MASTRSPSRDCGPEFSRRFDKEMRRFARAFTDAATRASSAREAGALAQAAVDRISMLSDEDAAHARR